ncbi:hypothetical protein, partial [Paraburkholderia sp. BR14427]|uniref:hypothetical protein n=1 Tax=Paraburkholderia sp. BR14427 TaxID=3237008 RepID=UPI0034CE82BD
DGDLKALFINDTPYQQGVSGQSQTYSDAYLELIFTFYRLFNWRHAADHRPYAGILGAARTGHRGAELRVAQRAVSRA